MGILYEPQRRHNSELSYREIDKKNKLNFSSVCYAVKKKGKKTDSTINKPRTANLGKIQSAAKLFEHLRQYLQFFSDLVDNFYYLMLFINSIRPKDRDLTNIYFIKLH